MFRRRTDYSWPLILGLVGLLFVSLKLPRQWERIARPTGLVLSPHKSIQTNELAPATATSPEASPLGLFRSIQPAPYVAGNADGPATLTPPPANETGPAVVVPVVVAKLPVPEVVPVVAPVEEPAPVAVEKPRDLSTNPAIIPEPGARPQPVLSLGVVARETAPAVPERSDEVRILRDVPVSANGPGLALDGVRVPEPEVRRLPPLGSGLAETQPLEQGSDGAAVVRQDQPSVVAPEPYVAAESSPAMTETTVPASDRPIAPEPQSTAGDNSASANSPSAVLAQPNSIATGDSAGVAVASPATTAAAAAAESSMGGSEPMKAIGQAWQEPAHLLLQLEELQKHEITKAWAIEASAAVHKLGPAISVGAPETAEILQRLEQLSDDASSLVTKVSDETLAQDLSRTSHALERRIPVWKQIGRMGGMVAANAPVPEVDPRSFNKCLSEIDQLTANSSEGRAWRNYLLIEPLHDWAARRRATDERLPRDLAQKVLARLNQMSLTSHQRQFLTSDPIAALQREMLRHTAEAVESTRLLQHLENYETGGLPSDAQLLARDCQYLAVGSPAARELGVQIELHYRNANIRIAVSEALLNRLMPKREPEFAPVKDTIQGAAVRGQSLMASDITVRMIPDPGASAWRWRSTARSPR